MASVKNIAINLGSTSTKIAYYEDGKPICSESLSHDPALLVGMKDIWEQYDLRKAAIDTFMKEHNIDLD